MKMLLFAISSLGMGAAMAQEGYDNPNVPYWTLARQADALRQAEVRNPTRVQAGSSEATRRGPIRPFDYSTLANPS